MCGVYVWVCLWFTQQLQQFVWKKCWDELLKIPTLYPCADPRAVTNAGCIWTNSEQSITMHWLTDCCNFDSVIDQWQPIITWLMNMQSRVIIGRHLARRVILVFVYMYASVFWYFSRNVKCVYRCDCTRSVVFGMARSGDLFVLLSVAREYCLRLYDSE